MLRHLCCCSYMQTPICHREQLQPFRPAAKLNLHGLPMFSLCQCQNNSRRFDKSRYSHNVIAVGHTSLIPSIQVALCDPNVMGGCFELRFREEDDSWTLQLWSALAHHRLHTQSRRHIIFTPISYNDIFAHMSKDEINYYVLCVYIYILYYNFLFVGNTYA